ncbi:MAG: hypothetical protein PW788_01565 [Micavibrio sp.]|nr:hypothetical protein [Micavibrio sp.]
MTEASKIDELLEKARRMKAQSGATPANDAGFKGGIKTTVIGDTLNDIKAVRQTADEVKGGMTFFKQLGLTAFEKTRNSWVGKAYAWAFKKVCMKKDKATGEKHLSKKRAGAFILSTVFLASAAIPGAIGTPARDTIGAVVEPMYDGARMTTMMHKDVYYLNDQHMASHEDNTWVVKGTREKGAGVDEATLFTVKPSLAHDIWNWTHKGHPFFIPDQVVAPVAPSNNQAYIVTSYGVRWRMAKWLQAYPVMLDAQPVTEAQAAAFNKAVANGEKPVIPAPVSEHAQPAAQPSAPAPAPQAPAPR